MEIEKLIERLDDCGGCDAIYKGKFVEANCRIASRLLEEAASALEQLQAENERLKAQVPRWIPVEERKPASGENPILIYKVVNDRSMNKNIGTAWYSPYHGWIPTNGTKINGVTHWMPLPKPPKEG